MGMELLKRIVKRNGGKELITCYGDDDIPQILSDIREALFIIADSVAINGGYTSKMIIKAREEALDEYVKEYNKEMEDEEE